MSANAHGYGCITRMWVSSLWNTWKESTRRCWELDVGSFGALILATSHRPLHVFCRGPVQALFMYLEPRAACLGLLHRPNDACTALLAVLGARPGLLVLDDVPALRAIGVVAVLLQVGLIDPEGSGQRWGCLSSCVSRLGCSNFEADSSLFGSRPALSRNSWMPAKCSGSQRSLSGLRVIDLAVTMPSFVATTNVFEDLL